MSLSEEPSLASLSIDGEEKAPRDKEAKKKAKEEEKAKREAEKAEKVRKRSSYCKLSYLSIRSCIPSHHMGC